MRYLNVFHLQQRAFLSLMIDRTRNKSTPNLCFQLKNCANLESKAIQHHHLPGFEKSMSAKAQFSPNICQSDYPVG